MSFDHAIDDASRKGTTLVTPLGAVTIGGRTFVVITEHGYEDERYVIFDAGGSALRRLLATEGGGC